MNSTKYTYRNIKRYFNDLDDDNLIFIHQILLQMIENFSYIRN